MTNRTSKHTGDDGAEGSCGADCPVVSPAHRLGAVLIPFPLDRCRLVGPVGEGGGDDLPPSFVMLGDAAAAVVMRLKQRLPRFVLPSASWEEDRHSAAPSDHGEGE